MLPHLGKCKDDFEPNHLCMEVVLVPAESLLGYATPFDGPGVNYNDKDIDTGLLPS